jgi:hypothetical protein
MKAVLVLVITWTVLVPETVTTAQAVPAPASRVSVSYVPPKDPASADLRATAETPLPRELAGIPQPRPTAAYVVGEG